MSERETEDAVLTRALRALAGIEAGAETPPRVEAAVMARWDAVHAPRARLQRSARVVRGAATIAAGVTLLATFALEQRLGHVNVALPASPLRMAALPPAPEMPTVPDAIRPGTRAGVASGDPTNALAVTRGRTMLYLLGDPIATGESMRVVRMRVASSELQELGLASDGKTETVDIDVLVGEDGVARVVRMVI